MCKLTTSSQRSLSRPILYFIHSILYLFINVGLILTFFHLYIFYILHLYFLYSLTHDHPNIVPPLRCPRAESAKCAAMGQAFVSLVASDRTTSEICARSAVCRASGHAFDFLSTLSFSFSFDID